jgi:hypothetical protein
VRVLVARRGSVQRVGETSAGYGVDDASGSTPASEPWPFTPENVARHRERLRARRTAAFKELQAISRTVRPDPGGLTAADYLDDVRGPGGGRTDDAG